MYRSLQHSHVRQLDQILCAGIVHKASLCCVWEHMEELQDNGALVMLASTKRPRQAKAGGADYHAGVGGVFVCVEERERHCVCFCVCCGFEIVCTCDKADRSLIYYITILIINFTNKII